MTYTNLHRRVLRALEQGGYTLALKAMTFAELFHSGRRKDGSHEFSHQVEMALMALEIADLRDMDIILAVCFLHDIREDYGIPDAEIRDRFGDRVADAVDILTKEFRGVRLPDGLAYARISEDPIAALVKGLDRTHNLRTMVGAFGVSKQVSYRKETADHIRPMLIIARRRYASRHASFTQVLGGLDALAGIADPQLT